jgi:hypothetical protein
MPTEPLPVAIPDLSSFARALSRSLAARLSDTTEPPGHVETLNLVARALGHRNVQSLRAALHTPIASRAVAEAPAALSANARKALAQFDDQGRLVRWPNKFSVQRLALWILWTRFEAKRLYTEREVNTILKAANTFGDHVTLRRELVDHRLLARKPDCSEYRKLPARADDEARALLHAWRQRR